MELKYKVIAVDTETRMMTVRYYSNTVTEAMLSAEKFPTDVTVNVPIPLPSVDAMKWTIESLIPVAYFQKKALLADPTVSKDLGRIVAMLGRETDLGSFNITPTSTMAGSGHVVIGKDGSNLNVPPTLVNPIQAK